MSRPNQLKTSLFQVLAPSLLLSVANNCLKSVEHTSIKYIISESKFLPVRIGICRLFSELLKVEAPQICVALYALHEVVFKLQHVWLNLLIINRVGNGEVTVAVAVTIGGSQRLCLQEPHTYRCLNLHPVCECWTVHI